MWAVPVFPKSSPRRHPSASTVPRFNSRHGLECFVINELLCPGLGGTKPSAVFIAQEPSGRAGNRGGGKGGRQGGESN